MDGVTVLNTFVEELNVIQPWCIIGLSLGIGGIISFVAFAIISGTDGCMFQTICCICVIASLLIGILAPRET